MGIPSNEDLDALARNSQWPELLEASQVALDATPDSATVLFFSALAHFRLKRHADAYARARSGRVHDARSEWGILLFCDICRDCGKPDEAFEALDQFLRDNPSNEQVRAYAADQAGGDGRYDEAIAFNAKRKAVSDVARRPDRVVVVQPFAKPDTLARTLQSLAECKEAATWALLLYQDGWQGSRNEKDHARQTDEVRDVVASQMATLTRRFFSVESVVARQNLGPYACCKAAIDLAARSYDYILFLEDDCVLAPDALNWFGAARELLGAADTWFVGGESIFFNDRHHRSTPAQRSDIEAFAQRADLEGRYHFVKFIPSSCFGVLASKWAEVASIRALPRGDEQLGKYMAARRCRCAMPVVPYVADIGMLNPRGFSMSIHGSQNLAGEDKNTYVMASTFKGLRPFSGDENLLFSATTLFQDAALAQLLAAQG